MVLNFPLSPGAYQRLPGAAESSPMHRLPPGNDDIPLLFHHQRQPQRSMVVMGLCAALLIVGLALKASVQPTLLPITSMSMTRSHPRLMSHVTRSNSISESIGPAEVASAAHPGNLLQSYDSLRVDVQRGVFRRCLLVAASFLAGVVFYLFRKDSAMGVSMASVSAEGDIEAPAGAPQNDLLIVGCGVLGRMVAKQWKEAAGYNAQVVGETRSEKSHDELRALGIEPQVSGTDPQRTYANVIFCAPAGSQEDYVESCTDACKRWNGQGSLLFTSSAGVYAEDSGGVIDEESPVTVGNPRTERLLAAEQACLAAGGNVVRLAGLYTADRGPHPYWLKMQQVQGLGEGLINMIAYEDAAAVCVKLLRSPQVRQEGFLVGDGVPITREDICKSARKLKRYAPFSQPTFIASGAGGKGKKYDISKVTEMLGWTPKYPSFDAFMTQLAMDE